MTRVLIGLCSAYSALPPMRYDPMIVFALEDTNADTGKNCGHAIFEPPLTKTRADVTEPFYGPPNINLENPSYTGDQCGDYIADYHFYSITPYFTFTCTDDFMKGRIHYVLSWHQNANSGPCNSTTNLPCPEAPSKCQRDFAVGDSLYKVVDLEITKTIGGLTGNPPLIHPGDIFYYDIEVKNNSGQTANGFTIYDDLPIWLKPVNKPGTNYWFENLNPPADPKPTKGWHYEDEFEPGNRGYEDPSTPEGATGETFWDGPWGDNIAEYCSIPGPNVEGCNGFGDVIKIKTANDLGAGKTLTYRVWVTMFDLRQNPGFCDENPGDPRCEYEYGFPDMIENQACVWPYDKESVDEENPVGCQDPVLCGENFNDNPPTTGTWGNNCDAESAPTKVKIAYFVAGASEKGVTLKWETSSELNNMGFNLYRSTSPFGAVGSRAEKLNPTMIPSTNPGGNEGAAYSWDDTTAKPGVKYYYWLEDIELDGKTNLTGPVDASVSMKISPIRIAPNLGLPVFRP